MVALDTLAADVVQEVTASFPNRRVLGAWLYGSRGRGEARADSDIDIAILCDVPLDPVARRTGLR